MQFIIITQDPFNVFDDMFSILQKPKDPKDYTLLETNQSPLNIHDWKMILFHFGFHLADIFRGFVFSKNLGVSSVDPRNSLMLKLLAKCLDGTPFRRKGRLRSSQVLLHGGTQIDEISATQMLKVLMVKQKQEVRAVSLHHFDTDMTLIPPGEIL